MAEAELELGIVNSGHEYGEKSYTNYKPYLSLCMLHSDHFFTIGLCF